MWRFRCPVRTPRWTVALMSTAVPEPAGNSSRNSGAKTFRVMSYNVLSPDVGFNCAPWLMYLSRDTVALVNARIAEMAAEERKTQKTRKVQAKRHTNQHSQAGVSLTWKYRQSIVQKKDTRKENEEVSPEEDGEEAPAGQASRWKNWEGFKRQEIYPHYIRHFHANHNPTWPNMYSKPMRQVYASPSIETLYDLPPFVRNSLGVVESNLVEYTERRTGHAVQAATLVRLLTSLLGQAVGSQVFKELRHIEDTVFAWPIRGPLIIQRILKEEPDVVGIQEYGGCDDETIEPLERGHKLTMSMAMASKNYSGLIFKDPKKSDGLALFFRHRRFRVAPLDPVMASSSAPLGRQIWEAEIAEGRAHSLHIPCQQRDLNDSSSVRLALASTGVLNLDLESSATVGGVSRMLKTSSRRHFGLARLLDTDTGRYLWVAVAHLQTDSRDNERTVQYPGEVRAGELAFIRGIVAEYVPEEDGLVFLGDMNTEPTAKEVWAGKPCRHLDPDDCLAIRTGFGGSLAGEVETGGEPADGAFVMNWRGAAGKGAQLREGFESLHHWNSDSKNHPTSFTMMRSARIDYIFYSTQTLRVEAIPSQPKVTQVIPNEKEPSDHLPVVLDLAYR